MNRGSCARSCCLSYHAINMIPVNSTLRQKMCCLWLNYSIGIQIFREQSVKDIALFLFFKYKLFSVTKHLVSRFIYWTYWTGCPHMGEKHAPSPASTADIIWTVIKQGSGLASLLNSSLHREPGVSSSTDKEWIAPGGTLRANFVYSPKSISALGEMMSILIIIRFQAILKRR